MRKNDKITLATKGFEILNKNKIREKYTFASIFIKNIPSPNADITIPLINDKATTAYNL